MLPFSTLSISWNEDHKIPYRKIHPASLGIVCNSIHRLSSRIPCSHFIEIISLSDGRPTFFPITYELRSHRLYADSA